MIDFQVAAAPGSGKTLTILQLLGRVENLRPFGDAVLVSTDVLLPDGSAVVLSVEGGRSGTRFVVHDSGAGLAVLSNAGLPGGPHVVAAANRVVRSRGLHMEGAAVASPPVEAEAVPAMIKWVADSARRAAEAAVSEARKKERRLLRERVQGELRRIFGEATILQKGTLRGRSNDAHRFDFLISAPGGLKLALDTPTPDPSSVAAVVIRHLDVRAAELPGVRQAIAFDEADAWPSNSLDQLRLAGVPLIAEPELWRLPERFGLAQST
ncbi:hypothetical protein [Roseomonas chloroacetimidivorans]|uniref:hypothetical protein n=1 Tax=Roseomonas chloroacetimidivorans TaxID=1766656 RepID=UPI003C7780FE